MRIPKRYRHNKNNYTGYCGFNEFGGKQTLGESMFSGREEEMKHLILLALLLTLTGCASLREDVPPGGEGQRASDHNNNPVREK